GLAGVAVDAVRSVGERKRRAQLPREIEAGGRAGLAVEAIQEVVAPVAEAVAVVVVLVRVGEIGAVVAGVADAVAVAIGLVGVRDVRACVAPERAHGGIGAVAVAVDRIGGGVVARTRIARVAEAVAVVV